ncbi:MarR family winged helix-turn-helix transcriptional regulator [Halopelagius longus]|uniref:DNA-binding transcriptional regulator, MarR family n=1 Tax=Halopelagius longus TaxID=1236180 RepID=A0A1H1AY70_9EURY|nr:MarR family winged helix-turn-helix transcriptional regulator [Halopelagius longus]RDI70561.1 MarR family transcriptional regulator [Halopelagius longus]SDQ44609.1 DNA-binding transcriptional regulator, MarR family [Halopelagius longus]
MSETWDAAGYIASSRYRLAVCKLLSRSGPDLPSRIAEELDLAQPHVSRALSELRERDIVELLVPESQQKGRLYGLTADGQAALARLRGQAVNVEFVDESRFPYENLLDYLRETHNSEFRFAIAHDEDRTDVYLAADAAARTHDEESISSLVASLETDGRDGVESSTVGQTQFVVRGLERATLVQLPTDRDEDVFLSLERGADVSVESFVENCRAYLSAER